VTQITTFLMNGQSLVWTIMCEMQRNIAINKTEKSFSNLAASQFCYFKSTTTLQYGTHHSYVLVVHTQYTASS
jgi:hypothetical protein